MPPPRDEFLSTALGAPRAISPGLPDYLADTYTWAYINPRAVRLLDRPIVVSTILWGNADRLMRAALAQIAPASRVLQAAHVYGTFVQRLADRIGPRGSLEVVDVAPVQVERARAKLANRPHASVRRCDIADPACSGGTSYDAVSCFFLLHEVPEWARRRIVDNLLAAVRPGGTIVFVDYHRPHPLHPLRPVMEIVFRWLEPFASSLFDATIESRSARARDFTWKRSTRFLGLYQVVVGTRKNPA